MAIIERKPEPPLLPRSIPLPIEQVRFRVLAYMSARRVIRSLVPKPKVNLTRFHGVFAPNSKYRILVTPARRGKGRRKAIGQDKTPEERRTAMTWAQRLKRVFNIDVESCAYCGGPAKVIACIEDQQLIGKILSHLKKKDRLPSLPNTLPETRAPPQTTLFHV